jgi:preprotein translocase subunit SecD
MLGVMISVFTALVVTRAFMEIVVANLKSKDYAKWFGI